MRRRLALLSAAVSSLVVLAFLVPLGILVRNQAQDRVLRRAERDAQSVAAALAVAGSFDPGIGLGPELAEGVLNAFGRPATMSIVFPDGAMVGRQVEVGDSLETARRGAAFTAHTEGGAEVLVPVLVADTPEEGDAVVVRVFVAAEELGRGVAVAWAMLAGLGLFLVGVAVAAADRLGRSIVEPVGELSAAARELGEGNLRVRVEPGGPPEIAEVGEAFNTLARRLDALLAAERESVADLSHRLRTPLTALRLQVETLTDPEESASLLEDIHRMEAAVDELIATARSPADDAGGAHADLVEVLEHRLAFWEVLARSQDRRVDVEVAPGSYEIPMSAAELGALVDALVDNVLSHTPPGAGFRILVRTGPTGAVELVVEDEGPGFADLGVLRRGVSRGGGTGLGLDIVAKAARATGGDVVIGSAPGGGARVLVVFGPP
ncbi:MAG TPA: HAMP domain-containing histidine kinase [Actinobacteria bacterium]|nr:HAMP domain-containing histidine kinase [Actinomycetota bacterium]